MLQYWQASRYQHTTGQKEVERGMKLKQARTAAGLGRRSASRRIGMGIPQLYRYEAGLLRPGIETVMRISRGLRLEDPWQVDEFRPALEEAKALGLVTPANKNGSENRRKEHS
jgi:transcriptional regulator with XRE-family HTH domain